MMSKCFLSFFFAFFSMTTFSQLTQRNTNFSGNSIGFYEFLPPDFATKPASYRHPVIISLHGVGERGDGSFGPGGQLIKVLETGIPLKLNQGATMQFTWNNVQESFIVLAPQLPVTTPIQQWDDAYIDAMIAYAATITRAGNLKADMNRVFLTGFSLGGGGCWKYASASAANALKLAGIIPIAGSPDGTNFCNIANNKVATWAFQANDDQTIDPNFTISRVNAINACANLNIPARLTLYPDGNHSIWNPRVYDTSNFWHYPNIYQWMMKVSRSLDFNTNLPPVADIVGAPPNYSLTVPVKEITLDGSASFDPDDLIVNYTWEKVSGPPGFATSFTAADRPTTKLVRSNFGLGMELGTYRIKLKVQDYLTTKRPEIAEEVFITVALPSSGNALPAADAGPDITLTNNQTSTTISANSRDWDGFINTNTWNKISGPAGDIITSPNSSVTSFNNLATAGTYVYEYVVTDNSGGQGKDTVAITKLAALPVSYEYLKGQNLGKTNIISWGTLQEINNNLFEIQRAADGVSFKAVGVVTALNGNGKNQYQFTDANSPAGISYYRLRQEDKDGKSTISKTIAVKNNNNSIVIDRYPNPVKSLLSIAVATETKGTIRVFVTDIQGRIIIQQQWNKEQVLLRRDMDVANLAAGSYYVVLQFANGSKETVVFNKL